MGYTHYWTPVRALLPELPRGFVDDAEAILSLVERRGVPLEVDWTPGAVHVNGIDYDHEDFVFCLDGQWAFCKTAQKPYDLAVTALLALAEHHGLAIVTSDGEPPAWEAGVLLARGATGQLIGWPAAVGSKHAR